MAYFKPFIDKEGIHIPTYSDIKNRLIEDAKSIFGQDIYLDNDSQDYQFIATVSEKIYDAFQMSEQVYNNRAPNTAIGVGLDGVIKINGIKRKSAVYSTCKVTLIGEVNTEIKNGIVVDKGGVKWSLPSNLVIPEIGMLDVIATCVIPGPVVANPGDIDRILNPVYGWGSVHNLEGAKIGSLVEDDSRLRVRQSQSTAQASLTILEGTRGSVAQIEGVTRSELYENDTNEVDELGLPPHSITIVAEGGDSKLIAKAIHHHKGPGCYTNGDVIRSITDEKGQVTPIRFFRPEYIDIDVRVKVKSLNSYTTETTESIKNNLQTYLNSMDIGTDLSLSSLWGASLQAMPNLTSPLFSILSLTAARLGELQSTEDITLSFKEVCRGNSDNIIVEVV